MRFASFALFFAACSGQVALQDQYDGSIGPLFGGPQDGLTSPYQVGATFDIEVLGRDGLVDDLTVVSSDPDVLTVVAMRTQTNDNTRQRFATVEATGPGQVQLEVRQGERTRHSVTVDVMTPDRIVFAPLQRVVLIPQNETLTTDQRVERLDVLVGSEAEFELLPMAGTQRLAGGIAPGLVLTNGEAEAGEYRRDNELDVVLIAAPEGTDTLTLTYPGQTFTATVEGHTQPQSVDLLCVDSTEQADEFGGFGCVATAETANGDPLFGVFPQWQEVLDDGTVVPLVQDARDADIMTYQIDEDDSAPSQQIRIEVAGTSDTEQALGPISSAELQNSNTMTACSAVSPWSLWLAGPALLMLGLRRRRD